MVALQCGNEPAIGSQHLYTVVQPICHVDIAVIVHADPVGPIELANAISGLPKAGQPFAVSRKLLDAVVAPVGHEHISFLVQGDTPRHVELAGAAAKGAKFT